MNKLVRHWAECAALTTEQRYCLSVQQLNQIADELERITELEARTLTVKLPHWFGYTCSSEGAMLDACVRSLESQGFTVQIEGEE